jgi:hypothetical protein
MNVNNLQKPIDFYIQRDLKTLNIGSFMTINATSMFQNSSNTNSILNPKFVFYSINVTNQNVSLHIQIKPIVSSLSDKVGYLALLKFGSSANLNESTQNFDLWNVFCPTDLRSEFNDSFYMFFSNVNTTNGYQGFVGLAFHELDSNEYNTYCSSNNNTERSAILKSSSLLSDSSSNYTFMFNFGLSHYSYFNKIHSIHN